MAAKAEQRVRDLGDRSLDEFYAAVADDVRGFLRERYPPGGCLGYVRWIVTDGVLERGELASVNRRLSVPQARFWWALRVVLSVALLAFGVGSQTLSLGVADAPAAEHAQHPSE